MSKSGWVPFTDWDSAFTVCPLHGVFIGLEEKIVLVVLPFVVCPYPWTLAINFRLDMVKELVLAVMHQSKVGARNKGYLSEYERRVGWHRQLPVWADLRNLGWCTMKTKQCMVAWL